MSIVPAAGVLVNKERCLRGIIKALPVCREGLFLLISLPCYQARFLRFLSIIVVMMRASALTAVKPAT